MELYIFKESNSMKVTQYFTRKVVIFTIVFFSLNQRTGTRETQVKGSLSVRFLCTNQHQKLQAHIK